MGDGGLESCGARRHGHDLGRPEVLGQSFLEGAALAAGGDPSAAEHPDDGVDVVLAEVRRCEEDLVLVRPDRVALGHQRRDFRSGAKYVHEDASPRVSAETAVLAAGSFGSIRPPSRGHPQ